MFRRNKKVEYVKVKKSDLELMVKDYDTICEYAELINKGLDRLQMTGNVSLPADDAMAMAIGFGSIRGATTFWKAIINEEYLDK